MVMPAKRSDQRLGHRTAAEQARTDTSAKAAGGVVWPAVPKEWCGAARRWFRSLQRSGQAVYFEQSDVEAAMFLGWAMTEVVKAGERGKFSPTAFGEVWGAMGDLLTTEGARRKARIELQQPDAADDETPSAGVSHLDAMRARMEGQKASGT
jgi:hypothetical protein